MKSFFRLLLFLALGSIAATLLLAAPVVARPLAQDPTAYDYPTDEGYNPPTDLTPYIEPGESSPTPSSTVSLTPTPGPSPTASPPGFVASPTTSPTGFTASPTIALTPSISPTRGRNLFGTEDAEMGSARLTPAQSETPSPNNTLTPTLAASTLPADNSAFILNRGWFAAGILLPLIVLLCVWFIQRARRSGEFG